MGNTEYTMREFLADDVILMPLRQDEREMWRDFDLVDMLSPREAYPSRTLLANDIPLACYGLMFHYPSLACLWSFISADAYRHRFTLFKALKSEWVNLVASVPLMRRVETLTREDKAQDASMVKHLGFRQVAVKEQYGPNGETMIEWEWTRRK